jgi:tRNA (mo5U34)-methyltransferase
MELAALRPTLLRYPTIYEALRRARRWARKLCGQGELTADELRRAAAKIRWYHTIDLGHGIITPGIDISPVRVHSLGLPESLRGLTVLDVGAWDGYYSFEAERRGARRVLATDSFSWGGGGWGTQDGFRLARRALRSRVQARRIDVLDLSPRTVGTFDVVLFLGVLYHMRHPLLALERVFSVTQRMLILETHIDLLDCDRPSMAFYPGAELNGDETNWCGPNPAMVEAMLRTVGFREVKIHAGPFAAPNSTRMVFHAWR